MADKRTDANEIAERIEDSVPTAENEVTAGNVASAEEATAMPEEAPVTDAPAPGAPAEPTAPAEPSRRDRFREGVGKRNPELDMDDDDAYYDYLDGQMSERDGYEGALNNIRASVDQSPEFAEMLAEASEQENFSPIHYFIKKVREGEIDLDELQKNPDYAEQWTEAQAEWEQKKADNAANSEEAQKNFDESIALLKEVRDEKGLTDAQINEVMDLIYTIHDDLDVNKVQKDVLLKFVDAMNYSTDVENARNEGKAEGLNTRVKEELRKPVARNRAGGSQSAMPERKPREENTNNMFGI